MPLVFGSTFVVFGSTALVFGSSTSKTTVVEPKTVAPEYSNHLFLGPKKQ